MRAFVRPPPATFARCLRSDPARVPDLAKALDQHRGYVRALRSAGVDPVELPPDADFPDSCFVADAAVVVRGVAILARPGAESRRGEAERIAQALATDLEVLRMERGSLDGGDVILLGSVAFIGLSNRTDAEGAVELARLLRRLGVESLSVPVGDRLHLQTAATPIGEGRILQVAGASPVGTFGSAEIVETDEPQGGNVLAVGSRVLVSAAAPRTAERLTSAGLTPVVLDVSEFHAADAGMTCLSLVVQ